MLMGSRDMRDFQLQLFVIWHASKMDLALVRPYHTSSTLQHATVTVREDFLAKEGYFASGMVATVAAATRPATRPDHCNGLVAGAKG